MSIPAAVRHSWILANCPWRLDGAPLGVAVIGAAVAVAVAVVEFAGVELPQAARVRIAMVATAATEPRRAGWWVVSMRRAFRVGLMGFIGR
jgi:hypothetical protein